jgi:predicted RNA-binding protein with EMAP domain
MKRRIIRLGNRKLVDLVNEAIVHKSFGEPEHVVKLENVHGLPEEDAEILEMWNEELDLLGAELHRWADDDEGSYDIERIHWVVNQIHELRKRITELSTGVRA